MLIKFILDPSRNICVWLKVFDNDPHIIPKKSSD